MSIEKYTVPSTTQVAVVGGGIGGLAAALFLRARGFDVHVFEAKSWIEVEDAMLRGNGIHLYFHCARMLQMAGLPIDTYLTPLDIQMRRDDGKLRADITRPVQLRMCPKLEVTRASVYSLLRQQLYRILVKNTPRDRFHCDKRCVSTSQEGERAEIEFDDDTSVSADLVIGADGIHSTLAEQLFGNRELVRHDVVIVQGLSSFAGLDPIETWLIRRGGGTMGLVPSILPTGEPGTFWWITVSTSEIDRPERTDLDLYHSYCKKYSWKYVDQVAAETDPSSLERWFSQDRNPLQTWSRGRIVMLGDACHAATPFSGYGAGMSIEDAYWLARTLGEPSTLDRPEDFRRAVSTYENKRVAHTTKIVHDARRLMGILHPPNRAVATAVELAWRTRIPGPAIARRFISVFENGLADTEWTDDERRTGRLAL